MTRDRSLIWFLGSILCLALIATVVSLVQTRTLDYRRDDTPEAVVHNYILALQRGDAEKAASLFLQDGQHPDVLQVQRALAAREIDLSNQTIQVRSAVVQGDQAVVTLEIYQESGPFGGGYSYTDTSLLKRQDGAWRIDTLPYPLWSWNWDIPLKGEPVP